MKCKRGSKNKLSCFCLFCNFQLLWQMKKIFCQYTGGFLFVCSFFKYCASGKVLSKLFILMHPNIHPFWFLTFNMMYLSLHDLLQVYVHKHFYLQSLTLKDILVAFKNPVTTSKTTSKNLEEKNNLFYFGPEMSMLLYYKLSQHFLTL